MSASRAAEASWRAGNGGRTSFDDKASWWPRRDAWTSGWNTSGNSWWESSDWSAPVDETPAPATTQKQALDKQRKKRQRQVKRERALSAAREEALADTIVYETGTNTRLMAGHGQQLPGPERIPGQAIVVTARRLTLEERQTPEVKAVADAKLKQERLQKAAAKAKAT